MSTVLNLEKHKGLFKDEEAFRQFTEILASAAECESPQLVVCGEEVVGAFVSPDDAQERMRERIMRNLAKNPGRLDLLRARLESDDLVPSNGGG